MNLLRLSAARALKIVYEQYKQRDSQVEGVIIANRSVDAFIRIAQNILVKVREVVTTTYFRIIINLIRLAILSSLQYSLARLIVQYNVFRRVTCRIISNNRKRNSIFIVLDLVPQYLEFIVPTLNYLENQTRVLLQGNSTYILYRDLQNYEYAKLYT